MANAVLTEAEAAELMTKKEAAKLLRCSTRTIDRWRLRWAAEGKDPLGLVQVGKFALFRRKAVQKLFDTPKLWL